MEEVRGPRRARGRFLAVGVAAVLAAAITLTSLVGALARKSEAPTTAFYPPPAVVSANSIADVFPLR